MRMIVGLIAACIPLLLYSFSAGAEPREPTPISDGEISLDLNGIRVLRPPAGTVGILIAQPAVATVRIGRAGEMILTGTGIGTTRFIFQDGQGRVLGEGRIRVASPADWLHVNAGAITSTYVCHDVCLPVRAETSGSGGPSPAAPGPRSSLSGATDGPISSLVSGVGAGGAAIAVTPTAR